MKRFFSIIALIRPYWKQALLNIIFNILAIIFSLVSLTMIVPFLGLLFGTVELVNTAPEFSLNVHALKDGFYYLISSIIIERGRLDALVFICVLVVFFFFFKNLCRYMAMFFLSPVHCGIVKDLRNMIFKKILILPLSYYSDQRKGDIIARSTTDVEEVKWTVISSLEMIFREPLAIVFFLAALFIISAKLTLFVLLLLPFTIFVIGRIGRSLRRTSAKAQNQLGILLSTLEETISGLRIIKAFNAIDFTENRFKNTNTRLNTLMVRAFRKRDLSSPLSEFMGALVLVVVMWFGGKLVLGENSSISPEVFIAYVVIFSQLIPPAKALSTAFYNIQKGIAASDRIFEVLEAPEIIEEKIDAISIKTFNREIVFDNVSFAYAKEPVLNKVNLKIEKGKSIALVGVSGSGKTTVANLLPRFYDCESGTIFIDGVSIKDLVISDLRGLMGIVSQEPILFNDTIFNNIAFGMKDVSESDVIDAAKVANAHDFIMQLENGYQSNIGDCGGKLSGGQKQRISIARAVLKNPPILILDEATSSLDTESEKLVQDALYKLMKNRTSLVIAHRLTTIQHADEIVVMQDGSIAEKGTHNELIALNGVYKKLCDLQTFDNQ
ncbi:MAG: ABC transporter ATP-binding protein [Bacteroidales bacterium]|nr:ABC transporter ATP-binding protein [Bacteroidales bacterium]